MLEFKLKIFKNRSNLTAGLILLSDADVMQMRWKTSVKIVKTLMRDIGLYYISRFYVIKFRNSTLKLLVATVTSARERKSIFQKMKL